MQWNIKNNNKKERKPQYCSTEFSALFKEGTKNRMLWESVQNSKFNWNKYWMAILKL